MGFDFNIFRDRAIISVDELSVSVRFTHWTRKRRSFSLRWEEVTGIEVIQYHELNMSLMFVKSDGSKWGISEDMENWNVLLEAVRKHFPAFDRKAFEETKRCFNKSRICWSRAA